MSKIIIIDGNSLLFRAYYATSYTGGPLLSTSYGTPTNAVVAFSNMLVNIMKNIDEDDGIFVAFDKGKHTFRHQEYAEYKANRKPCPEELLVQMPIARELLKSINVPYYEMDEIEADDIAGIMAKKASKKGYKVLIYTSDHDYLQLIDENITVNLIKRGLQDIQELSLETFKNEYGIEPIQITDFKGLLGDPSDNLPGIPKIGEKTALSLIKEFGDLENIIKNSYDKKGKIYESIIEFQESGRMSKRLATIDTKSEIVFDVEDVIYKGLDINEISTFCERYELKKLIAKLPKNLIKNNAENSVVEYTEIENFDDINLDENIGISIDEESENYHKARLFGLAISTKNSNFYISTENLLKDRKALEFLRDKSVKKYCYDYKKIKVCLQHNGIEIDGLFFDLMLSNYLLDSSLKIDFDTIMLNNKIDISYAMKNDFQLFNENNPLLAAVKAHYSLKLFDEYSLKLKSKDQYDLLNNIEQPLATVLANMEIEGFPVNKNELLENKKEYEATLKDLEKQIYELAGEEFNISSPKQLGVILFEKLGLSQNKKSSTSANILKDLKDEHPIIPLISEYRKYAKMISQYVDGIVDFIGDDGKIHATFNQAVTATGRLSSSEPNLQNITTRDEKTKTIKKAFHYEDKNIYILSLDYSQIELRVLAHMAKSQTLINIFKEGKDIHSETAKLVFHLDREPTSQERRISKAVNFGIIYGISDYGLSENIDSSIQEAKQIITNFYNTFPEIKDYLNSLVDFAKTHGYATTIFNRRRYLDELNDPNYQVREFAKRAAMNAPIQGSAADLIKIAMIKVDKELRENNLKSKIISQIHDELIIKTYDDEKDKVYSLVKDAMENCAKLDVELKVDGGYASTWYDAK